MISIIPVLRYFKTFTLKFQGHRLSQIQGEGKPKAKAKDMAFSNKAKAKNCRFTVKAKDLLNPFSMCWFLGCSTLGIKWNDQQVSRKQADRDKAVDDHGPPVNQPSAPLDALCSGRKHRWPGSPLEFDFPIIDCRLQYRHHHNVCDGLRVLDHCVRFLCR